jgi:outer membrane protein assembly factor BamD
LTVSGSLCRAFPNSEYSDEAGEYISELRDKLARKTFEAGEFYKRTNRYNAAATYYDIVIDNYPETRWAERSLVSQMESYILFAENSIRARQEERFELALDSYNTYLQLFPRGDSRSRVEDLYDRAQSGLRDVRQRDSEAQS